MKFVSFALAAFFGSALPVLAHNGIHIHDPYARIIAGSGVVYFTIDNHEDQADRLIGVTSDIGMAMLMTSAEDAAGVMKMSMVPGGLEVAADAARALQPAGDHVMVSGVTAKYRNGDRVHVTLTFEKAGVVALTVPVDNARRTPPGMGPTEFDAVSAAVAGGSESSAIVAAMAVAMPDAAVTVAPLQVMGDDAIVGWQQGDKAGRALLRRVHGQWQVLVQAGADLRVPAFLTAQGVQDATMLSDMFNAAEDAMGAEHVARASTFQGVVITGDAAHN